MFSTAKPRSLKMWRSSSGVSTRSSHSTKIAPSARPATMHAQVPIELQPQMLDCWSPSTSRPMPAEIRIVPR